MADSPLKKRSPSILSQIWIGWYSLSLPKRIMTFPIALSFSIGIFPLLIVIWPFVVLAGAIVEQDHDRPQ